MQQAFKTLMGQMNTQNNQFNNAAFPPGTPFPFPSDPASARTNSTTSQTSGTSARTNYTTSQTSVTVDVPATEVEARPTTDVKDETELKKEPKKIGNKHYIYFCYYYYSVILAI